MTHIAAVTEKTNELLIAIKALADVSPETPASDEILSGGVNIRSQVGKIVTLAIGSKTRAKA